MVRAKYQTNASIQSWQRTSLAYHNLIRFCRAIYTIVAVTVQIPLVAADTFFNKVYYGRHSWTFANRLFHLLLGYGIWAFNPGTRPPFDVLSPKARESTAALKAGQKASLVTIPPRPDKLFGDALYPSMAAEPCPSFWQWLASMPSPLEDTTPVGQRKVIMYVVGGGMVQGHPIEAPLSWKVMEVARIPVFGVNFRKCVTKATAFPAALQDAVAGLYYLLDEGYAPENISMMGDSGGACIVVTALLYLKRHGLKLPGSAILVSPWVDLVDRFDEDEELLNLDILNPAMLSMAAYQASFSVLL